tara:strand:+ start:1033 stop:1191 length:159 start_codon:yes stop_codon:yes gene_type:complete
MGRRLFTASLSTKGATLAARAAAVPLAAAHSANDELGEMRLHLTRSVAKHGK